MATPLPQYEILRRQLLAQDPELQRLRQQQAQTRGQLFSAPFAAREENQNIFNPQTREKLISQAVGNVLGQLTGYNDLVEQRQGRTDQMVKLVTDYQAEQNAAQEAKAKAAQQAFENQIALAKLNIDRSKIGSDTLDDTDISGFVSLALDNYGDKNFDLNAFVGNIPSKQRSAFMREYAAGVASLEALTPEQQQVVAPETTTGGGIGSAITNFFKGLNKTKVNVPRVPDIGSMSPNDILNSIKKSAKNKTKARGGMSPAYKAYLERRGGL